MAVTPMIIIQGLQTVELPLHIEDIESSYSNNFRANAGARKSHPDRQLWGSGSFSPISFQLKIGALREGKIQNAEQLMDVIEKIGSMALPQPGKTVVESVTVKVGNWFRMKGLMKGWTAAFTKPWDENGNPLTAIVSFQLEPTFAKNRKPNAENFSFRF